MVKFVYVLKIYSTLSNNLSVSSYEACNENFRNVGTTILAYKAANSRNLIITLIMIIMSTFGIFNLFKNMALKEHLMREASVNQVMRRNEAKAENPLQPNELALE